MSKQQETLRLALDALENTTPTGFNMERDKQFFAAITAIKEALAQPEQEPVALPPVQFEKVAEGIEVGYDFLGGVDIRLGGEFVYVHINYDYRYTHNAARKALADQIVGLLTTPPQRTWVGLTSVDWNDFNAVKSNDPQYVAAWAEAKLKEKNHG